MRVRSPRWFRLVLPVLLLLALCVAPVRAADEKPFVEPNISFAERSGEYIQWVAGALFIAACLLSAVKNPHRSHLD